MLKPLWSDINFSGKIDDTGEKNHYTIKHVYSDYAYNGMMLITKRFGIPCKHSIFLFINFMLATKLHITKSRIYKWSNFEVPRY